MMFTFHVQKYILYLLFTSFFAIFFVISPKYTTFAETNRGVGCNNRKDQGQNDRTISRKNASAHTRRLYWPEASGRQGCCAAQNDRVGAYIVVHPLGATGSR